MQQTASIDEENVTEIYTWGANRYGQLGLGNELKDKCYNTPRFCSFSIVIKEVACGEEHTAIITGQGQIYTFGSNSEGRLGLGDKTILQSSTPCLVESLSHSNAINISCGWGHTAAILDNGELYMWGVGEYGALGLGNTEAQWFPVKNLKGFFVISVSCGTRHTAIVDDRGNLYTCGSGDAGQLGTGSRDKELEPKLVTIPELVECAACGIFHTLVLTKNGKVYAMGGNYYGQLGIGNKKSSMNPVKINDLDKFNIVRIAAGNHSGALTDGGDLYVWGTGTFGEYLSPTLFGQFPAPLSNISIGGLFGVVLDIKGKLYSWGSNTNGELGTGDFESRTTPYLIKGLENKVVAKVSCGGAYTIALGKNSNEGIAKQNLKVYSLDKSEDMQSIDNEVLSEERQRRIELETQLKGLEQSTRQEVDSQQFKDKIMSLERQIEAEKRRADNILKENMKPNSELERKAEILKREIELLREENANLRAKRITNKASENAKLSDLLKEYEERIEKEIEEKYRVMRNKQKEISNLRETLPELKSTINDVERNKQKLEDYYKGEEKNLEAFITDHDIKISQEEEAIRELVEVHSRNIRQAEELRSRLSLAIQKRDQLTKEIENCKNDVDKVNYQALNKQAELEQEVSKYDNLQETLAAKEDTLGRVKEECSNKEAQYEEEINNLRWLISEKNHDNEDIENKISVKQIEIDTLKKDMNAWQQVVNNVLNENEALKRIIARLEDKSSKLRVNDIPRSIIQGADRSGFLERSIIGGNSLHALQAYLPEESSDEGRVLDQGERISDPYLQQQKALQDFERMPEGRY